MSLPALASTARGASHRPWAPSTARGEHRARPGTPAAVQADPRLGQARAPSSRGRSGLPAPYPIGGLTLPGKAPDHSGGPCRTARAGPAGGAPASVKPELARDLAAGHVSARRARSPPSPTPGRPKRLPDQGSGRRPWPGPRQVYALRTPVADLENRPGPPPGHQADACLPGASPVRMAVVVTRCPSSPVP